ncbi:hypothetical protein QEN19_000677 [Hanseniaspora menglaensis]
MSKNNYKFKIKHKDQLENLKDSEIYRNKNFKKLFYVILFLKLSLNYILPLFFSLHKRKGFFQPDEYYQTLNVAYNKAFKHSSIDNTWEWKNNLRSYLFPFIIEIFGYRLFGQIIPKTISLYLNYVRDLVIILNTTFFNSEFLIECSQYIGILNSQIYSKAVQNGIEYGPILVMCFISAITDFFIVALIYKINILIQKPKDLENFTKQDANNIIKSSFLIVATNFFGSFFGTRSFINNFELLLNTVALYFFDWNNENSSFFILSLTFAFLSILQRPTNAVIWIILGLYKILTDFTYLKKLKLFKQLLVSFLVASLITMMTDYYFYEELCFPIVKFIEFNFTKNLSVFYGSAPMNFHIFQSIPLINGITLPYYLLSLISVSKSHKLIRLMHFVLMLNLIAFSLIDHKEFRFLYPVQQLYLVLSTIQYFKTPLISKSFGSLLCYGSCILGWVLAYFNESGVIELCDYINKTDIRSIGFLMPCHSTPGISYMNQFTGEIWQLSCEPPLSLLDEVNQNLVKKNLVSYQDESDIFYADYYKWLDKNVGSDKTYPWPECIAMFSSLSGSIYSTHLRPNGYLLEKNWFNTLKHWDGRRDGDVELYCKT